MKQGLDSPLQYSCLENPHGQRSLAGYSPRGHQELAITKWLSEAQSFSGGASDKESSSQWGRCRFHPWAGKIPWSRKWQPLQYSCLENSMDSGAWHATVHGTTKIRTWLSNWTYTHVNLRINTPKGAKDLSSRNCRALMKETENDTK